MELSDFGSPPRRAGWHEVVDPKRPVWLVPLPPRSGLFCVSPGRLPRSGASHVVRALERGRVLDGRRAGAAAQLCDGPVLVLRHPGAQLGLDRAMCSGPWRSRAEVIITTSAPTSERLDHVGAGWRPDVAASETSRTELRSQDGDPAHRQAHLPGLAQLEPRHDLERLEVEVGLVEAVEQHEPVGAGRERAAPRSWRRPSSTG